MATKRRSRSRTPLNRQRVLDAAVAMADDVGIEALSMRKLAQSLGVEAMSLYNHVSNKDDILDGIVDMVVGEIALPSREVPWREAMRARAASVRAMFGRHPWAIRLMDSRQSPGSASLKYYDAVIGCLREAGFSIGMAAHAFAVLDSFVYGFAVQEASMPIQTSDELESAATDILEHLPVEDFPHLTEMIVDHTLQPGYSFAQEFDFGLDLILDGLERALARSRQG